MTQDEIIEMARQAGFKMENSAAIQAAEIFANLVAAKKQEPVAWMTQARNFIHLSESTEAEAKLYGWKAVYTHPQRTWVGLTGEEAMDITRKEGHELLDFIYEYGTGSEGVEERIVAICKAIEAKLKEKNT